jgi:hypothetical protein
MKNRNIVLIACALFLPLLGCGVEEVGQIEPDPIMSESGSECSSEVPAPADGCVGVTPAANACADSIGEPVESPKMLGSSHPNWTLQDLQPQSCGYLQHYGLSTFHGTPSMVVLLWAGCGFCRGQAEKLQQMHDELTADDVAINFIIVDLAADNPPIELLTEVCGFPIFQDTEAVGAWGLHEGVKDDFFFYDAEGVLEILIPAWGEVEMNLSTEAGYRNIKNAALVMAGRDPEPDPEPEPPTDPRPDSME